MSSENLIHVRLNYDEALAVKKDLLSSQIALLKIARVIRNYGIDRNHEINLKINLQKKIKELKVSLNKLHKILPKPKIPEIIRKEDVEKDSSKKERTPIRNHDESLEGQLQEIQRKLGELQTRGA